MYYNNNNNNIHKAGQEKPSLGGPIIQGVPTYPRVVRLKNLNFRGFKYPETLVCAMYT